MRFRLQLVTQNTHSQLIVLETYCRTTLVATSNMAKLLLRVDALTKPFEEPEEGIISTYGKFLYGQSYM